MGILDYLVGRAGLGVNPATGERVRIRKVPSDNWGNIYQIVEEKNQVTGQWVKTGDVPGSVSGGHY